MNQYKICGNIALNGEVNISGAKNAALGILPSALLTEETVTINNLPDVSDIHVMLDAFKAIGAKITYLDRNTVTINAANIHTTSLTYDVISTIRASYYFLGALLGRKKEAKVGIPGGCRIGKRPIDMHIKGFKLLNAEVTTEDGLVSVASKELKGGNIFLDKVSVGATINIMMAASCANGDTVIENCAKEPHIVDVANFLNSMGAQIKGAGTDIIRIKGVEKLHGCEYSIIPDQIEAGTYMMAAVATGGDVLINNVIPKHLEAISAKIIEMGSEVIEFGAAVRVIGKKPIKRLEVTTSPYPGFPTDMQPQIASVLALCDGESKVRERVFEQRFKYIDELNKLGAKLYLNEDDVAVIEGIDHYTGGEVVAPDLRAGAALVIAGLASHGTTIISDIQYIQRGYESIIEKLCGLNAQIEEI